MKKYAKRVLPLLLSFLLAFGSVTMPVYAEEGGEPKTEESAERPTDTQDENGEIVVTPVEKTDTETVVESAQNVPAEEPEAELPEPETEAIPAVASVGEFGYGTLAEAFAAAEDDDTVVVLQDATIVDADVEVTKSITLDLNGKTVEADNTYTGNLHVTETGALTLMDSAEGGKIVATKDYASGCGNGLIQVDGSFIMNSGEIYAVRENAADKGQFAVTVMGSGKVTVYNGKIMAGWYAISGNGSLTKADSAVVINGGILVSTADYAIYHPAPSLLTINGGMIDGAAGAICTRAGSVVINDGYLKTKGTGNTGDWADGTGGSGNSVILAEAKYGDTTVTINGGIFNSEDTVPLLATNGTNYTATIVAVGGHYSADPSAFVPREYKVVLVDDSYNVVEREFAAQIGEQGYYSLGDAFRAAQDGDTIVVLEDTSVEGESLRIKNSITLDLNGKIVSGDNSYKYTGNFPILPSGKFTLKDSVGGGKIVATQDYTPGSTYATGIIYVLGEFVMESGEIYAVREDAANRGQYAIQVANTAKVTINGGKITAGWFCITGNGSSANQNTTITVNGGSLTSTTNFVIYQPQTGTTVINGGSFNGAAGIIDANRGTITINGGDFYTDGSGDTGDWSDGTGGVENRAIRADAKYGDVSITITGGNFNTGNAAPVEAKETEKGTGYATVVGGTFSADPSDFVPREYKVVETDNGYEVVVREFRAQIGEQGYYTLGEAFRAAQDGDVIVVLEDESVEGEALRIATSVTLDLNGKTVSADNSYKGDFVVMPAGKLTLKDSVGGGKIVATKDYTGTYSAGIVYVLGEFVMESGEIYAVRDDAVNKGQYGIVVRNEGKVTINGGKIVAGWYCISGNGGSAEQNTTITVNGGCLISTTDFVIYQPQTGKTVINGGSFSGAAGIIDANRGDITINGGKFYTDGTGDTGEWADGTGGVENRAIRADAKYGDTAIAINGGDFYTGKAAPIEAKKTANGEGYVTVKGGTFSADPSEYVAENYTATKVLGRYVVTYDPKPVIESTSKIVKGIIKSLFPWKK